MEYHIAMKASFILALIYMFGPTLLHSDELSHLVLVTSVDSAIETLSPTDVRRLYLGASSNTNRNHATPIRNQTDPLLEEVFLQKVIYMSAKAYNTRLISSNFRLGVPMPRTHNSWSALVKDVAESHTAVTFMWDKDLVDQPQLKKISELWSGSVE